MSKFLENVNRVQQQLVEKNPTAMDLEAGKSLKVRTIFGALTRLGEGKYKTLNDMYKANGFTAQNKVYEGVSLMLKNLGTPVTEATQGRKKKLDGTQLVLDMLTDLGLELPVKEEEVKSEEKEVSNELDNQDAESESEDSGEIVLEDSEDPVAV